METTAHAALRGEHILGDLRWGALDALCACLNQAGGYHIITGLQRENANDLRIIYISLSGSLLPSWRAYTTAGAETQIKPSTIIFVSSSRQEQA